MYREVANRRTGWHAATITMVVCGCLAMLLFLLSLVGWGLLFWSFPATCLCVICGLLRDRTWRAIIAVFPFLSFLAQAFVAFFLGLVTSWFFGLGLLALAGSVFCVVAAVACAVEFVQTINGNGSPDAAGFDARYAVPNVVINNSAQVGSNLNSPGMMGGSANAYALNQPGFGSAAGRVALFDGGRSAGMQVLQVGQRIVAGRDHSSQLLVTDPAASRHHLEILFDGQGWIVRDLGAMNPARVISGEASGALVSQSGLRMRAGQLTIGNAVLTLFPPGAGQA